MTPQGKYGTGFAVITLLLLSVLFYFYASKTLDARYNPNQVVQVGNHHEIILKAAADDHFRANGTINGYPVRFLVDTGATMVALNERTADEIGLKKGSPGTSLTANGETTAWSTNIRQIDIGGIVVSNVPAHILPNMDDDVLLGMSFLKHFDWQNKNNELILIPRQSRDTTWK